MSLFTFSHKSNEYSYFVVSAENNSDAFTKLKQHIEEENLDKEFPMSGFSLTGEDKSGVHHVCE